MIKALIAAVVVVAILLLALSIETWRERRPGPAGRNDKASAFLILVAAGVVLLLAVMMSRAAQGALI